MRSSFIGFHILCLMLSTFSNAYNGYQYNTPNNPLPDKSVPSRNGFPLPLPSGYRSQSLQSNGYQYNRPAVTFFTTTPQAQTVGFHQPFRTTPQGKYSNTESTVPSSNSYQEDEINYTKASYTPSAGSATTSHLNQQPRGYPPSQSSNFATTTEFGSTPGPQILDGFHPGEDDSNQGSSNLDNGNARPGHNGVFDNNVESQGTYDANTGSAGSVGSSSNFPGNSVSLESSDFKAESDGNMSPNRALAGNSASQVSSTFNSGNAGSSGSISAFAENAGSQGSTSAENAASAFSGNADLQRSNSGFGGADGSRGLNSFNAVSTGVIGSGASVGGADDDGSYKNGDFSAIPGSPDADYPIFARIPTTSFNCNSRKFPGYYADVEARCQVFHICVNGLTYDFLCPNGTIFSQMHFVCVWWNQFDCNLSESLYYLNENLYDYSKVGAGDQSGSQGSSSNFGGSSGPRGPSTNFGQFAGPQRPASNFGPLSESLRPSTNFNGLAGFQGSTVNFGPPLGPEGPSANVKPSSRPQSPNVNFGGISDPQGPSENFAPSSGPQRPLPNYSPQSGSRVPSVSYGLSSEPEGTNLNYESTSDHRRPSINYNQPESHSTGANIQTQNGGWQRPPSNYNPSFNSRTNYQSVGQNFASNPSASSSGQYSTGASADGYSSFSQTTTVDSAYANTNSHSSLEDYGQTEIPLSTNQVTKPNRGYLPPDRKRI